MHIPCACVLFTILTLCSVLAVVNDDLENRITLTLPTQTSTVEGTTIGAGVEPGEINEAALPANPADRSVWYEFNVMRTGTVQVSMRLRDFSVPAMQGLTLGMAAYTAPAAQHPLTMNELVPAGAGVKTLTGKEEPHSDKELSGVTLRLWGNPGERILLRLWTRHERADAAAVTGKFSLTLSMGLTTRYGGDVLATATVLLMNNGYGAEYWVGREFSFATRATTDTADCRIGSNYYPACSVQWYRLRSRWSGMWRLSAVNMRTSPAANLMILRETPQGLSVVTGPAASVTFPAIAGEELIVRAGANPVDQDYSVLIGGPAAPGDEPADAVALQAGQRIVTAMASFSASAVHAEDTTPRSGPDRWFRLHADEPKTFRVEMLAASSGNMYGSELSIYQRLPDGSPGARVSTGARIWLRAEAGADYLVRLKLTEMIQAPLTLSVTEDSSIPPANDEPAGATALAMTEPLLVRGIASGSSMSEAELSLTKDGGATRTVWYSLDWPGEAGPWVFAARGAVSIAFAQNAVWQDSAAYSIMLTPGAGPVLLRVDCPGDERFLLVGRRFGINSGRFGDAEPIFSRKTEWVAAPASAESPGRWHYWDADADGPVHLAARGAYGDAPVEVFTGSTEADLLAVRSLSFLGITAFHANRGMRYWFLISVWGDPVGLHLRPGGWTTAYDAWIQRFPAWEGEPAILDPQADADGDGIPNLLDMAFAHLGGLTFRDIDGLPEPVIAPGGRAEVPPGAEVSWTENYEALAGLPGGARLRLLAETSMDLVTWTPQMEGSRSIRLGPGAGTRAARFLRFRVTP